MKWNEAIAVGVAIWIAIVFLIFPVISLVGAGIGIGDADPKFSAFKDGYNDVYPFAEDIEKYNSHVRNSIFFETTRGSDETYDYKIRSMVSSPTLLLGELIDPKTTVYVAIGIERAYTQEEIRAINSFLARGGHAIIADDFGYANQLANQYGVTFYGGQFYDESFDRNANYTIVTAHLGSDIYDKDGVKVWSKARPYGDGAWDDDQDGDGKIDEDDGRASSQNFDDDRDNPDLGTDLRDNDNDNVVDEENEGFDEDAIDDDVTFRPRGDADVLWYGHENVDLEWLDGVDNDGDEIVDEDLQSYQLITYKPTGLASSVNAWIWCAGTSKSFIDMDDNGILSIPSEELEGKNADEVSSIGNEIQFCVEVPVADDGTGAVDVINGVSQETIQKADGEAAQYRVRELNPESDKVLTQLGSIVFISDPSLFMKDLYNLNHIRYDVNLPWDPEGNGEDDDNDGTIDEDREILRETGDVSEEDKNDRNDLADKSQDFWSEKEVDTFDWLTDDMVGTPKLDYDNQQFLLDLIHHLCPAKEGETNLILFDESRHSVDSHLLRPVYKTMEITAFLTSSPYYAYPLIISIGFLLIFSALLVQDKESWAHRFDISELVPRKSIPSDARLQTMKLRLMLREKLRLNRGLSPEEFATLNERTIIGSVKDPELIELLQNQERTYTTQEIQRFMEKIKKVQNI